jgi:hypothetical protein
VLAVPAVGQKRPDRDCPIHWRCLVPWQPRDAKRHTKKADTPKEQRMWSKIANDMLAGGASEGKAIRVASGVVKKRGKR